jgi:hypothetical protein
MIEQMLAHFKEWLAFTLAPFLIKRKKAQVVPPDTTDNVTAYLAPKLDASSFGETKHRLVNELEPQSYDTSDDLCECGQLDDDVQQSYRGDIHVIESDANGVESESNYWQRQAANGKLQAEIEEEWKPYFRLETAAEAYARFVEFEIHGDCLAQLCERHHYANLLKTITVDICRANPDTYEHISALMTLSPVRSYSRAEMTQFRRAARALKRMIDLHYAYENAGGEQAERSFNEAAYLQAKLDNAIQHTQLASELVQAAETIAHNTESIAKFARNVHTLAKRSAESAAEVAERTHENLGEINRAVDRVADNLCEIDRAVDRVATAIAEIPEPDFTCDLIGVESAIEQLNRTLEGNPRKRLRTTPE